MTALKQQMIACKKREILHLKYLLLKTIYNACAILTFLMFKEKKAEVDKIYLYFVRIIKINEFSYAEQSIDPDKRQDLLNDICIPKPDDHADDFHTPLSEIEKNIQTVIHNLFIKPQQTYVNAISANKHDMELQRLARTHLAEQKAVNVTMIIDAEQSVTPATLNKIIDDKVNSQLNKKLKKLTIENKQKTTTPASSSSNNTNNNNQNHSRKNSSTNTKSSATTNYNRNRNNHPQSNTKNTTNEPSTSKNNNRGASSASLKKKPNTHDDRDNASPKRKRDESTDSSKRRRRNTKNHNNNKQGK
jgi:hypothetical protein